MANYSYAFKEAFRLLTTVGSQNESEPSSSHRGICRIYILVRFCKTVLRYIRRLFLIFVYPFIVLHLSLRACGRYNRISVQICLRATGQMQAVEMGLSVRRYEDSIMDTLKKCGFQPTACLRKKSAKFGQL